MPEEILSAEGINFSFEGQRAILSDLSIALNRGVSTAVVGNSGVGKTTLLEVLGMMRIPDSGEVLIDGSSVYDMSIEERSLCRGRYLGFVFQEGLLLPDLTIWENCRLAIELSPVDWDRRKIRDRFDNLMSQLGLDPGRESDRPSEFSTGECQRIAVVRAMMHVPDLLIADEPTGNLDPESSDRLIELILSLVDQEGTALLVATHDRNLARSLDSIYELRDGQLSPYHGN